MSGENKIAEIAGKTEEALSELREKIKKRKAWEDARHRSRTRILSVSLIAIAGAVVAFTLLWYLYGITPISILGRL